jgi:hypothetical protein
MTTLTGAFNALRSKLLELPAIQDVHGNVLPFRFPGEDSGPLPNEATAFAYVELENQGGGRGPASYGGGRGQNLYRNECLLTAYAFVPNGEGLAVAADLAEAIAARLRSFRDANVSCFAASVHPIGEGEALSPRGLASEVNNYTCAIVEVALHFDQIG